MSAFIKKVAPQDMRLEKTCLLLDVRTDAEYAMIALQQEHIHLPLDQLQARDFMCEQQLEDSTPLYIVCGAGTRAMKAAEMFVQAGLHNVRVVEGGISACKGAGLPLDVRPGISLDRQVRIFIGSVVLAGAMLSIWLHPDFSWLVAAIGVGVLLSGVSGWCGMALLLAKAPWNKSSPICCR